MILDYLGDLNEKKKGIEDHHGMPRGKLTVQWNCRHFNACLFEELAQQTVTIHLAHCV
jgi:hypothetical protein